MFQLLEITRPPKNGADPLGHIVSKFVLFMSGFYYIASLFLVLNNFDSSYFVLREIARSQNFQISGQLSILMSLLSYILRFIVVASCTFEFSRIVCLLVTIFAIQLEVVSSGLDQFHGMRGKLTSSRGNVKLRSLYVGLGIGIGFTSRVQGPTTATLMALAHMLAAVCTIAMIRMWDIIPMPLYLIFPTIAICVPTFVLTLLPRACNCYETSAKLLRTWRDVTAWDDGVKRGQFGGRGTFGSRERVRTTAALRPYKLYASVAGVTLYVLKKSTKTTFLYSCMDTTVNGLVSFK